MWSPWLTRHFFMHDNVARRRRSIFFGGRVALRVLWVPCATERQCALGSEGFRSHGGEGRQTDKAGEAWWSWSWHGARALGGGDGRYRSAHEPEAWPAGWSSQNPLAGFTTPSGALHGPSMSPPSPVDKNPMHIP